MRLWLGWVVLASIVIQPTIGCGAHVRAASERAKDTDNDGVADSRDKCPQDAEDGLPPDPNDGCPGGDVDHDGIAGIRDKCPEQPETFNGVEDQDGCPESEATVTYHSSVQLTANEIKISEKIVFDSGKATIDQKSNGLLDEIANVMKGNSQIELVEVAGHADQVGNDAVNVALTKRRAAAVVDALVRRGVDAHRMRAQGYGRFCPLDTGTGEAAREKNRRVEFMILRLNGKDTNVKTGCAAADAKGIKAATPPQETTKPRG